MTWTFSRYLPSVSVNVTVGNPNPRSAILYPRWAASPVGVFVAMCTIVSPLAFVLSNAEGPATASVAGLSGCPGAGSAEPTARTPRKIEMPSARKRLIHQSRSMDCPSAKTAFQRLERRCCRLAKNVFEKCSGAGVSPAVGASRPCVFTGETPVHRRPEARATIFQTGSKADRVPASAAKRERCQNACCQYSEPSENTQACA